MKFAIFSILFAMVAASAWGLPAASPPANAPVQAVNAPPQHGNVPVQPIEGFEPSAADHSGAPKAKRDLLFYTPYVSPVKYYYPTYYYYHSPYLYV